MKVFLQREAPLAHEKTPHSHSLRTVFSSQVPRRSSSTLRRPRSTPSRRRCTPRRRRCVAVPRGVFFFLAAPPARRELVARAPPRRARVRGAPPSMSAASVAQWRAPPPRRAPRCRRVATASHCAPRTCPLLTPHVRRWTTTLSFLFLSNTRPRARFRRRRRRHRRHASAPTPQRPPQIAQSRRARRFRRSRPSRRSKRPRNGLQNDDATLLLPRRCHAH